MQHANTKCLLVRLMLRPVVVLRIVRWRLEGIGKRERKQRLLCAYEPAVVVVVVDSRRPAAAVVVAAAAAAADSPHLAAVVDSPHPAVARTSTDKPAAAGQPLHGPSSAGLTCGCCGWPYCCCCCAACG